MLTLEYKLPTVNWVFSLIIDSNLLLNKSYRMDYCVSMRDRKVTSTLINVVYVTKC